MIDLKTLYGDKYRIVLDESAQGEPRSEYPWYYRIKCKRGFISLHGEDMLAAWTDRPILKGRLASVDGVKVHQQGDKEIRVIFTPDHLDAVLDVLQPYLKRHISPEQRERLIELGRETRFPGAGDASDDEFDVPEAPDGSEPDPTP